MTAYKLIKDGEGSDLQGNVVNCSSLRFESGNIGADVEPTTYHKIRIASSPRPRSGLNIAGGNSPSARLVSLDVFRGLTVALMIFVDDAGGILPSINHSPWNGLTLADFIMPFFLFMVGVSLGLVYKNMPSRIGATKKALLRTGKLIIFGLFLQGGFFHGVNNLTYGVDMYQIRWMGILQRIALGYFLAALCEIWLRTNKKVSSGLSLLKKYGHHWAISILLTAVYLLLSYGLYVPNWEYEIRNGTSSHASTFMVNCGVRGDTGPACNAAGMIDRTVLGIQHLYRKPIYARTEKCSVNSPDYGALPLNAPSWCQAPFDPEGILSTVMAIVTCLIGLQYGHVLVHFKEHKERLLLWLVPSSGFIVSGVLLDIFGMHINKALYSCSYMCVTTGVAGILFATIYLVVDAYEWKRYTTVLEWMGKHALMIYILVACNILPLVVQGFYWKHPRNNILTLIGIGRHQ